MNNNTQRKPEWLKIKLETGENYPKVKKKKSEDLHLISFIISFLFCQYYFTKHCNYYQHFLIANY